MKRRMNRRHEIKETRKNGLMGFNGENRSITLLLISSDANEIDFQSTKRKMVIDCGAEMLLTLTQSIQK